ncbi:MAG: Lrp/AsnC family transcriptional regulator [Cytophagales bacterium]|nr:Lrp/AsnC family transcriptional regulator [Cytophagales bacterium]
MNDLDDFDIRILRQLQLDASLSNQALARLVHVSAPTCLRRVKRLREAGYIEREVAILSMDKLAPITGFGLTALVEVTLDVQNAERLDAFERRACSEPRVQQCYRVSPGPDFMLIIYSTDMPAYLALSQSLFSSDANVRNARAFFSVKRGKLTTQLPL